jgi:DNA-binding FadR family transcriptional regulator
MLKRSRTTDSASIGIKKVGKQGVHEHVIREIGRRIVRGELRPGTVLPREAVLLQTLGVSRTALREALRVLAAKGLLEARQKKGTIVRAKAVWNYLDAEVFAWRLDSDEFKVIVAELHQLRNVIEPFAASLAARNATQGDHEILKGAYREMEVAAYNGLPYVDPDVRFHMGIIAASGNSLLISLGQVIGVALRAFLEIGIDNLEGQIPALAYHKAVLDAIVAGKALRAQVAMRKVIEHSERDARQLRLWRTHHTRTLEPRTRSSPRRTKKPPL